MSLLKQNRRNEVASNLARISAEIDTQAAQLRARVSQHVQQLQQIGETAQGRDYSDADRADVAGLVSKLRESIDSVAAELKAALPAE